MLRRIALPSRALETGQIDVRYTTLDRYVSAVSREKARLVIGRVRAVSGV